MFLSCQYVSGLTPLVSAAKQDHHKRAFPSIVDPIPGTEIDSQFLDAAANGFAVSEVAQPDSIETGAYDTGRLSIPQRVKPVRKRSRTALLVEEDFDSGHILTVAYKLPVVNRGHSLLRPKLLQRPRIISPVELQFVAH
jgi:hypothetical protein